MIGKFIKKTLEDLEGSTTSSSTRTTKTTISGNGKITKTVTTGDNTDVDWEAFDEIFEKNFNTSIPNETESVQSQVQQSVPRNIKCKNCGANNTLSGENSNCEYCDSPLEY